MPFKHDIVTVQHGSVVVKMSPEDHDETEIRRQLPEYLGFELLAWPKVKIFGPREALEYWLEKEYDEYHSYEEQV